MSADSLIWVNSGCSEPGARVAAVMQIAERGDPNDVLHCRHTPPCRQGRARCIPRTASSASCCVERGDAPARACGDGRAAAARLRSARRACARAPGDAGAPVGARSSGDCAGRAGFRPRAASSCWASTDFDSKPRAIPYCTACRATVRMPLPEPIIGSTCTSPRRHVLVRHSGGRVSAFLPRACLPPRARWLRHAGGPNRPAPTRRSRSRRLRRHEPTTRVRRSSSWATA